MASIAGVALIAAPSMDARAMGFGGVVVDSEIGQPFRATVELSLGYNESVEELTLRPAEPEEYTRQLLPFASEAAGLQVLAQLKNGRPVALITTVQPIITPTFHFILSSHAAAGRSMRAYSVAVPTSALDIDKDGPAWRTSAPAIAALAGAGAAQKPRDLISPGEADREALRARARAWLQAGFPNEK